MSKIKEVTFAPDDKIGNFARQLVQDLFNIQEFFFISNISLLDDFKSVLKSKKGISRKTLRKALLKVVEDKYNISMENYPEKEPLYVWKVAEFVKRKLRES